MVDFVVGRVEEHVDAGGSRFSESFLEHWRHANRYTVECGTPGMLKSMSSSLMARLNLLSVLSNATSRCSSGACCSFTVCALELLRSSGCPDRSWICSTRMFSDLFESQDLYQPKIPRLDVSSKHYASIVHDVVHWGQSLQDLDALCLWDQ